MNNVLKLTSSSITSCGMDSKPLAVDKGVDLSILANSAVGIVGTLYPVFDLSNVIASCGEQVNLFDTKFFKEIKNYMSQFSDVTNNFNAFIGSFDS
ncbi:hypothetical protein BY996DRAFT_4237282 [Phakopsora pachyrhizi]|nr:hypothetical protein BY996DRAFT_4237282 [Phakopsora pachyrhizi]